ncbi:MAG: S8 family serine peptidase, partial [Pseudomonadota bacterium]
MCNRSSSPAVAGWLLWLCLVQGTAHAVDATTRTAGALQPQLTLLNSDTCLQTGQRIRLSGSGLGSSALYGLWLQSERKQLELNVEQWSDTAITARLPADFAPTGGANGVIGLRDRRSGALAGNRLTVQFCTNLAEPGLRVGTEGATASAEAEPRIRTEGPAVPRPARSVTPMAAGPLSMPGAVSPGAQDESEPYEPQELIVYSASLAEAETLAQRISEYGYSIKRRRVLKHLGFVLNVIRLPKAVTVSEAMKLLGQRDPRLIFDANHQYRLMSREQAGSGLTHRQIRWGESSRGCGDGLRIGLIDTGVDTDGGGLPAIRIVTRSFLPLGVNEADKRHGTAIASLLVSRPGGRVVGLLPGARLFAAGVFRHKGERDADTTAELIIAALDWLLGEGVSVVNLSLAGSDNRLLRHTIADLGGDEMLLAAAAGNGGSGAAPAYPAALPEVVAVTAVDINGRIYSNANRGNYIDIAAPGVDVWAARPGSDGAYYSGTSFAAPFVSAAMALLRARDPEAGLKSVLSLLADSAIDLGAKGRDP